MARLGSDVSGGLDPKIKMESGGPANHTREVLYICFRRASDSYVSGRRGSAISPIRVKPRTVRSVRRAGGVHLALKPFRDHFLARYKIIPVSRFRVRRSRS